MSNIGCPLLPSELLLLVALYQMLGLPGSAELSWPRHLLLVDEGRGARGEADGPEALTADLC